MRRQLAAGLFAAFTAFGGVANATIVNLDATSDPSKDSGPEFTSVTLSFGPGAYAVTPVDRSTPDALYTAANRFSAVDGCDPDGTLCDRGWEHTYYVQIGDGTPVKHGYGEGISPSPPGTAYFDTAALAFANGVPSVFTLAAETMVTFSWLDDDWSDNQGGISLSVTAVRSRRARSWCSPACCCSAPSPAAAFRAERQPGNGRSPAPQRPSGRV